MIGTKGFADFACGAAGALSFEIMKAFEILHRLSSTQYKKLLRSPLFWLISVGMILAAGFIAWAFNSGDAADEKNHIWHVVATGIAARTLIREIASAKVATKERTLGPSTITKMFG